MSLYLQIDQDEASDFFEKYERLSPLRQRIWNFIVSKARDWKVNKTCQTKLGEWVGCSRSAISEAFKIFKDYGWMWLQSRGWKRSKIIEIPISKQQIDIVERKYFKIVKATYRATHTYSIQRKNTSSKEAGSFSPKLEIPDYLERTKLSLKNKLKLSMVPESVYNEALETARYHHSKEKKFTSTIENYVVGTAMNLAIKKNLPMNWKGFYKTMRRSA